IRAVPSALTSTDLTMPSSVIGRLISGSLTVARAAEIAVTVASVLADTRGPVCCARKKSGAASGQGRCCRACPAHDTGEDLVGDVPTINGTDRLVRLCADNGIQPIKCTDAQQPGRGRHRCWGPTRAGGADDDGDGGLARLPERARFRAAPARVRARGRAVD